MAKTKENKTETKFAGFITSKKANDTTSRASTTFSARTE